MANLLIKSRETIYDIYYILFLIALFYWVCCVFFHAKMIVLRENINISVKKNEYINYCGGIFCYVLYLLIYTIIKLRIYKFVGF